MSKLTELKTDLVNIKHAIEQGKMLDQEIIIKVNAEQKEIVLLAIKKYMDNIFGKDE